MRTSSVTETILQTLCCGDTHLTAQEIYDTIKARLPAVNHSTVYRSLERLVKSGKVSVSDMGKGAVVYELVQNGYHHHLVCQKCGATLTLPHAGIADFFHSIEQSTQFRLSTNHLVLFGICPGCRREESNVNG